MTIDEFSKSLIEKAVAELDEGKNKEGKEQGADGKACWKGYKYAGTENGKDKCVKTEEVEKAEKDEKDEGGKHKEYKHAPGKEEKGEKKTEKEMKKEAKDYLPGNQEKIDANKNGKVDAHDFALLRNKKAKKSVKEMWEKAAEVQEAYGKGKKKVAEGKKVEIEIMPDVDTPNDPEPPTGRKVKKEKELKKEEVEALEEKKLSKAETAKKEKFVKGMKKKFGSFKSKYGERAKDVMYGTATAMAKKSAK
jgi:hypothetical protein